MEKRRKNHNEAVSQLKMDLSTISAGFKPLLSQMGDGILHRLSEYNDNVENAMQRIENISDLTALSYQDMSDMWNKVCNESFLKRKWIEELDDTYAEYESERKIMISVLLRKYTTKLQKICFLMPHDVHRLMDNEAMMINQAMLANRCALAKLSLNWMEKHLQMEIFHRMRWEDKLECWKKIKLLEAVNRFKEFVNSTHIQNPESIQETVRTLKSYQKIHAEQRIQVLEMLRDMTPPRISESSVLEWYSALSIINGKIDSIHIDKIKELHKNYEISLQECLAEVHQFKTEVFTYGFTSDEIQHIVNSKILTVIGQCQSQTDDYLATVDKAFGSLAKIATLESEYLFKFIFGAAQLWETHCAGLMNREQQLQNIIEAITQAHEKENQRKEAQLDMMLDKLRQESSEEALKVSLQKAFTYFEEIKTGYVNVYKEKVENLEIYPSIILQELQAFSLSVSQFFNVTEVYGQDSEEFSTLYPSLRLGQSMTALKNNRLRKKFEKNFKDAQKAHCNNQEIFPTYAVDSLGCEPPVFSQTKETIITAKGNVYNCYGFQNDENQQTSLVETELVLYPKALILELLKDVRQGFFSQLEERFHIILANTMTVVEAKKEKLKSELDLCLQFHQLRAKRIEMDTYNVREAELVQHQDRVDQHCRGILNVLGDCRTELKELQIQQKQLTEEFQKKIYSAEDAFTFATKSEKIIQLCASLQMTLDKHLSVVQVLQRDFRQKMEFKMEGLREANAQIMKSFKLFSEGGNFTPQEIEVFQTHLEKMDTSIDSVERSIIQDMEGRESKSLEKVFEAKDMLRQFEDKYLYAIDLKFLKKMQQLFTNTRVLIKSQAEKSNMQKRKIDSILSHLQEIELEYGNPCSDKKIVTIAEITSLTTSLMEEMKMRCQYLECFLDVSMALPPPQAPLQGSFAVATRPKSNKQDKTRSPDRDNVFQPSCIGVSFMEDVTVEVVKGLLKVGVPHDSKELNTEATKRCSTALTAKLNSPAGPGKSQSRIEILRRKSFESMRGHSVKKSKPNRSDKRFQVFGSIPEEQKDSSTFKASVTSILWKSNNILLLLAEEFYKRKEGRPITCPQQLHDTFEKCAEEINKRLLMYQSQALDHHNSCLQEFKLQLKGIEVFLSSIPEKLLYKLRDQYLKDLTTSMTDIQVRLKSVQQESEQKKSEHSSMLIMYLSKPACERDLEKQVMAEEERQKQQKQVIQNVRQEFQACVHKNAQEFVTALAGLAESLLFQLDKLATIHEVQVGYAEVKRVNINTVIQQKQASLSHEEDRSNKLTQNGSRTWSGICYFGSTDEGPTDKQFQETATITTAKTTLGHIRTIEVRDALHEHYRQMVQNELERVEQECQALEIQMQQVYKHWQNQLKTLTDQEMNTETDNMNS